MRSDTNPNHVKRIFVTHSNNDNEYKHTIEFEWPVALCFDLDIAGAGATVSIYMADRSRPVVMIAGEEMPSVHLSTTDQEMHITIKNALVHCPGLATSTGLAEMAG